MQCRDGAGGDPGSGRLQEVNAQGSGSDQGEIANALGRGRYTALERAGLRMCHIVKLSPAGRRLVCTTS